MPFHAEHHAAPSVPFHALPAMHVHAAPTASTGGYLAAHADIWRQMRERRAVKNRPGSVAE
jgi:fatty acid desaturase